MGKIREKRKRHAASRRADARPQSRRGAAGQDLRPRLRPAHRYCCAGTVEFLLDERGQHVFNEMNPRIQLERTVPEETTDVDLVSSQLRIAAGVARRPRLVAGIDCAARRRAARITTADPANGFRPDTGRITAYRTTGGPVSGWTAALTSVPRLVPTST